MQAGPGSMGGAGPSMGASMGGAGPPAEGMPGGGGSYGGEGMGGEGMGGEGMGGEGPAMPGGEPGYGDDMGGGMPGGGDPGMGMNGPPEDPGMTGQKPSIKGKKAEGAGAYIAFVASFIALSLIGAACLGTPITDGCEFIKAKRTDANQAYKIGLFGDCIVDYSSNLQQCSNLGFGFELQGFNLKDSAALKKALGKGGTFFFFLPVVSWIAIFAAVIADNTHLALFWALFSAGILCWLSVFATTAVFLPAVGRINKTTKLEAKIGTGLILTVAAAVLMTIALACIWSNEAFQTCRPSHDQLGADDGRNENGEWQDPFQAHRGQYVQQDPGGGQSGIPGGNEGLGQSLQPVAMPGSMPDGPPMGSFDGAGGGAMEDPGGGEPLPGGGEDDPFDGAQGGEPVPDMQGAPSNVGSVEGQTGFPEEMPGEPVDEKHQQIMQDMEKRAEILKTGPGRRKKHHSKKKTDECPTDYLLQWAAYDGHAVPPGFDFAAARPSMILEPKSASVVSSAPQSAAPSSTTRRRKPSAVPPAASLAQNPSSNAVGNWDEQDAGDDMPKEQPAPPNYDNPYDQQPAPAYPQQQGYQQQQGYPQQQMFNQAPRMEAGRSPPRKNGGGGCAIS